MAASAAVSSSTLSPVSSPESFAAAPIWRDGPPPEDAVFADPVLVDPLFADSVFAESVFAESLRAESAFADPDLPDPDTADLDAADPDLPDPEAADPDVSEADESVDCGFLSAGFALADRAVALPTPADRPVAEPALEARAPADLVRPPADPPLALDAVAAGVPTVFTRAELARAAVLWAPCSATVSGLDFARDPSFGAASSGDDGDTPASCATSSFPAGVEEEEGVEVTWLTYQAGHRIGVTHRRLWGKIG